MEYTITEDILVPVKLIGVVNKSSFFILKFGDFATGQFLFSETRDFQKEDINQYFGYMKAGVKDYAHRVKFSCPQGVCKIVDYDDVEKNPELKCELGRIENFMELFPIIYHEVYVYGAIGFNNGKILENIFLKKYVDIPDFSAKQDPKIEQENKKNQEERNKIDNIHLRVKFLFPGYGANKNNHIDFLQFCLKNKELVNICFYYGEYCRRNREWLCNYKKIDKYNTDTVSVELIDRMANVLKNLIFESQLAYPENKNDNLEIINFKLGEKHYMGSNATVSINKDDKRFLVYAFLAGLLDMTDDEINTYWKDQWEIEEKEAREMERLMSDMYYDDSEDYVTDYTPEDAVMNALENGCGENFGY